MTELLIFEAADALRSQAWETLASRLSFDLRKIIDSISESWTRQRYLTEAFGAGLAGAIRR